MQKQYTQRHTYTHTRSRIDKTERMKEKDSNSIQLRNMCETTVQLDGIEKKNKQKQTKFRFVSVSFTSLKCCCCGSCCFRFLSFPFRLCKCLSCSSLLLTNYSNFNLNGGKAHEFKSLNSNLSKVSFSSTAFFFLRIYFDEGWGKTEN